MTTIATPSLASSDTQRTWRLPFGLTWVAGTLLLITLLALGLRLINIGAVGDGNTYYTAAVEAMLQSPSNFFFAAAEPGGSVTVDKPPLGLWVQALFAAVLGVSGFSVTLPQVIAGTLAIPVVYGLAKRYFGIGAGLLAALALAVTPVAVAVDRSNNMDSLLILLLLLAAWTYTRAADSGKTRWLLVGAVLVGLSFNVKMLQAFLPLPAFYALYLFGGRGKWTGRLVNLVWTSIVLLAVALSWAVVVELTPADARPYIGSSTTNSVFELIIGYNGLERLLGAGAVSGTGLGFSPIQGAASNTAGAGNMMVFSEAGEPGILRLLQLPLAYQLSWMLPFALFAIVLVLARAGRRLTSAHRGIILFGGWLLTGAVFFSIADFFHAYYLATIAPPLAILVGAGGWALWTIFRARLRIAIVLLLLVAAVTLAYQAWVLSASGSALTPVLIAGGVTIAGVALLIVSKQRAAWAMVGFAAALLALLIVPSVWAGQTALDPNPNTVLTSAYMGDQPSMMGGGNPMNIINGDTMQDEELIAYLEANTADTEYLVAVGSAMEGARLVLATERPVLYLGGFSGSDRVLTLDQFTGMVEAGRLRYVYSGIGSLAVQQPEIGEWVAANCAAVEGFEAQMPNFDPAQMQALMEQMPAGALPFGQNGNAPGTQTMPFPQGTNGQGFAPPGGFGGMGQGGGLYDCGE